MNYETFGKLPLGQTFSFPEDERTYCKLLDNKYAEWPTPGQLHQADPDQPVEFPRFFRPLAQKEGG